MTSPFQKRPAYRYIRKADKLPTYDQIGDIADPVAKVRMFNPTGAGTWWVAAVDDDGLAWGVAEIHEREMGTFSLTELAEYRGAFGLPIERDLYYQPQKVSQIMAGGG